MSKEEIASVCNALLDEQQTEQAYIQLAEQRAEAVTNNEALKGISARRRTEPGYEYCIVCYDSDDSIIQKANSVLSHHGLLERFYNKKFYHSLPYQKEMVETASHCMKCPEGGLFFGGKPGAGKSHLATIVFGKLMEQSNYGLYMQWATDAPRIRSARKDNESYIEKLKDCRMLFIDDLLRKPTASDIQLAYEILESRISQYKVTIITTEHCMAEFEDIDLAISHRLKEIVKPECRCDIPHDTVLMSLP